MSLPDVVVDKRIPDKWRDYRPCGIPIRNERIIAFKTPLSRKFDSESQCDNGLRAHERFTPSDLLEEIRKQGETLGMVIDLTNTFRYYNGRELEEMGVCYQKLKCAGQEIPSEQVVDRFKTIALDFFRNDCSDSLLGIHCTHGLNRAGYIVCRFLIECRGFDPEDAIEAFNQARGHVMERHNYLEDLRQRLPQTPHQRTSSFWRQLDERNLAQPLRSTSGFSDAVDHGYCMRNEREMRRRSDRSTAYGARYRPYSHKPDTRLGPLQSRTDHYRFDHEPRNRQVHDGCDLRHMLSNRRNDCHGNNRHGDYAQQSSGGYCRRDSGRVHQSYDTCRQGDGSRSSHHTRDDRAYRASWGSAREGYHSNVDPHPGYVTRRYGNHFVDRTGRPRRQNR